jgi:hypothetical protein
VRLVVELVHLGLHRQAEHHVDVGLLDHFRYWVVDLAEAFYAHESRVVLRLFGECFVYVLECFTFGDKEGFHFLGVVVLSPVVRF